MKTKMQANGEWGKEVWERKIKAQDEVGVIHGSNSTKKKVHHETAKFMHLFESQISPILPKKAKILDAGVGPMARFSILFAKKGYDVTGVDISPTTINYAKNYVKKSNVSVDLIEDDITELSNLNTKFDFIFCYETFFHIPPFLSLKALKRFNGLLNDDGYCLVQFGVKRKPKTREKVYGFFYWNLHNIKKMFGKGFKVNVTQFTPQELKSLVDEAGLKILKHWDTTFLLAKK